MQSQTFLDAGKIFDQIEIAPASTVADFGCGPGFFSLELARRVGPNGHVWSLDVLPQALESVMSSAANEGLRQIDVRRVNLEKENGSRLDTESMDFVVIKDMLFQNKDHEVILREAFRVLKSGARALVVEWMTGESIFGPAQEVRIPRATMEALLEKTGFTILMPVQAGDFHYGFVVSKP